MRQLSAAFTMLPLVAGVLLASGCAKHDSLYQPVEQARSTSIDASRQMLDNEPVMEEVTQTSEDRDDQPPAASGDDDGDDRPGPDAG